MSLRKLPEIKALHAPKGAEWDIPSSALDRWAPGLHAAADDPATISIYEGIGEQWDGSGMTAKRMGGILRSHGNKDVIVSINSPGGDFFEGVAMYNQLREHPAKVTVRVVGLAASAASVIAMAGDEVQIARTAFFMIHNAWTVVLGNRLDLQDAIDMLTPFDMAMADVYAARTGLDIKQVTKMMDKDTWIGGSESVDLGFADSLLAADQVTEDKTSKASAALAKRQVELALAKQGMTRSQRQDMLMQIAGGQRDATPDNGTRDAAFTAALSSLLQTFKGASQ